MKKTYINPSMEIVDIAAPQLLAGSIDTLGGNYGGGGVESHDFDLGDLDSFQEDPMKWLLNN
ncbi:MAG: hypothetical protein IJ069_08410 [Prevotella sp.]|nr:hypothetical protein [Prevotella sp.]MBQ8713860.1 hypothetical protein [Prevotella sp.]